MPPSIVEDNPENLPPGELAKDLAARKVQKVVKELSGRLPMWICSCDTLISFNNKTLGKAENREQAKATLEKLAGNTHEVITGMALLNGRTEKLDVRSAKSLVTFADMSPEEIDWYLETGEWQGVAGAYKIQGIGACFIKEIQGSWSCIAGLPLHEFRLMLLENGYDYR
jgi:septum formation protein